MQKKSKQQASAAGTGGRAVKDPAAGLDPVAAAYCRRILSGGAARNLGLEISELAPRRILARMALKPRHLNHNGRANGGVIMAFADLLGAVGAAMHRPAGYRGGTLESKTNFFGAGTGPLLVGRCIPLHIGRTTSVWQTTVEDAEGRMVAMVTQTQMALPERG
jgi:uncharacterized protein (TIGR00369 family)